MAFHSHDRGNRGYGGVDRTRGDSARALPTFEQEAASREAIENAALLLGGGVADIVGPQTPTQTAEAVAALFSGPMLPDEPETMPMKNVTPVALANPDPKTVSRETPGPVVLDPAPIERIPEPSQTFAGRRKPARGKPDGGTSYKVTETDLSALQDNPDNIRVHNPRNTGLIADSLREVGAARSVVIDEQYILLAGNAVKDACAEVGISKVLIVETDGETLVAVRRTGLTEREKKRLMLLDGRTSDLSEFSAAALRDLTLGDVEEEPGILDNAFTPEEVEAVETAALLEDAAREQEGEHLPLIFINPEPEETKRNRKRLAFRLEFDTAQQKRKFDWVVKHIEDSYAGSGGGDIPAALWLAFFEEHHPEIFDGNAEADAEEAASEFVQ